MSTAAHPHRSRERQREEFLTYLKSLGVGDECVTVPWLKPGRGSSGAPEYGRLMIDWQRVQAHRWVYREVIGPIPDDMEICHSCDNPPCVRPSHLWAGTASANMLDAVRKGRFKGGHGPVGERHGMSKLTGEDVQRIRAALRSGLSQRQVAKAFGVSQGQVGKIALGKAWSHIPLDEPATMAAE